ncbi:hypothetical protein GQX74_007408 [Glossina fuscipes]|nr:hypothetical protein GQX74_007408 [Glossina fuscipes]
MDNHGDDDDDDDDDDGNTQPLYKQLVNSAFARKRVFVETVIAAKVWKVCPLIEEEDNTYLMMLYLKEQETVQLLEQAGSISKHYMAVTLPYAKSAWISVRRTTRKVVTLLAMIDALKALDSVDQHRQHLIRFACSLCYKTQTVHKPKSFALTLLMLNGLMALTGLPLII